MADQGKWFKLWESALDDQQLENLELDNWARWVRLGTYLKKHGKDGQIIVQTPCRALQTLFRVNDFVSVIRVVKLLPSYVIEEVKSETANVTVTFVSFRIICQNWNKYQGDFSSDRVRRYRRRVTANVTVQEEKRRRREVEEKRRDSPNPHLPSAFPTSTPRGNGLKLAGNPMPTLIVNGKPYQDPAPDPDPMTPEEMARIKAENMKKRTPITAPATEPKSTPMAMAPEAGGH